MTDNGTTTTYTYDKNNRLLTETKPGSVKSYTYDANGNMLTGDGATYTYDVRDRQFGFVKGTTSASYTYYPTGLRKSKLAGGVNTHFIWDSGNMICEYTASATAGKVYVYGLTLISQEDSLYYIYNGHGDVVKYINSSGTVLKTYDYNAFGEEVNASSTDANPFRYAGQYFDTETGTYYLRARYYSPTLGRFTQQDAWGYGDPSDPLSLNLYVYCYGNPVRYYDPSGNIPLDTVVDAASALASLGEFAADPSLSNGLFLLWDVASLLLPYVPGSYVGKGVKLLGKTDDALDAVRALGKFDNITDATKFFADNHQSIVGSYKDIKKTVKALGLKGFEVHHLIEKRFAKTLGIKNTDEILSVALDKDVHKQITKTLRGKIPYDTIFKKGTSAASAQDIWAALVETYTEMGLTQYLPQLKQHLLEGAENVNHIHDWLGW